MLSLKNSTPRGVSLRGEKKNVYQKILSNVEIVHIYFFILFNILFQGKERSAKTKFMPGKLHAVLISADSDSTQY